LEASQPTSSHHLLGSVELTAHSSLPPSRPGSISLGLPPLSPLILLPLSNVYTPNIKSQPYKISSLSRSPRNRKPPTPASPPSPYSNRSCKTPKSGVFPPFKGLKSWFESFIVTNEPIWVTFEFRVCWSYCRRNENEKTTRRRSQREGKEEEERDAKECKRVE